MSCLKTSLTMMLIMFLLFTSSTEVLSAGNDYVFSSFCWSWIIVITCLILIAASLITLLRLKNEQAKDIDHENAQNQANNEYKNACKLRSGLSQKIKKSLKLLEEIESSLTKEELRLFIAEVNDIKKIVNSTPNLFMAINAIDKTRDQSLLLQYEAITEMIKNQVIPTLVLTKDTLDAYHIKLNYKRFAMLNNQFDEFLKLFSSIAGISLNSPDLYMKSLNQINDTIDYIKKNHLDFTDAKQSFNDLLAISTEILKLSKASAEDRVTPNFKKRLYAIFLSARCILNQSEKTREPVSS